MADALQVAKTRCERFARNRIYPGGQLHMAYHEDKEVGTIYVALGKGDVAVDGFGREPTIGEAVNTDLTLVKDVWRGQWMGYGGEARGWCGDKVNCIAGDWSFDQAVNEVLNHAKETLKALR